MTEWRSDPRLPFLIAALLGMIAGVAAKQAVSLSTGDVPRPISLLADFLVLGIIMLIVMYAHSKWPTISLEGIALLSAALAMWGPRGIAALLSKFKIVTLTAAEQYARSLSPVEPTHRPTVSEAVDREKEEAVRYEDDFGKKAPIRKLRDVIPVEEEIPVDEATLLGKLDQVAPDYHSPNDGGKNGR